MGKILSCFKKSTHQDINLYVTKEQLNKILNSSNIIINNIGKNNDFIITIDNIKYILIQSEGEI
jgi:hypothetical protein